MVERKREIPLIQVFRQNGIPERLLYQMDHDGLQQDYRNKWIGPLIILDFYNPADPKNYLAADNAKERIHYAISHTQSYSTYWRERLRDYNDKEVPPGTPPIDPDWAFNLLTSYPKTGALDVAATQALNLLEKKQPLSDLVRSYVRIAANIETILYGKKDAMKLLRRYGLLEKRASDETDN